MSASRSIGSTSRLAADSAGHGSPAVLTRAEKYERVAFTFCKMGTIGLMAWLLTPPVFVLLVASLAIGLYARAMTLGVKRSRCFLRKPALIIGFWSAVVVADAVWILSQLKGP